MLMIWIILNCGKNNETLKFYVDDIYVEREKKRDIHIENV